MFQPSDEEKRSKLSLKGPPADAREAL